MVSVKYTVSIGNTVFRYMLHKHGSVVILPRSKNTRSLNKRFIRNMESSARSNLRKVATDSIEEAIEKEVKLTTNDVEKINEYKQNIQNKK